MHSFGPQLNFATLPINPCLNKITEHLKDVSSISRDFIQSHVSRVTLLNLLGEGSTNGPRVCYNLLKWTPK